MNKYNVKVTFDVAVYADNEDDVYEKAEEILTEKIGRDWARFGEYHDAQLQERNVKEEN